MLRKIVTALIVIPLAIVIIAFAVANRQIVTVSFDPFSSDQPAAFVTLPLYQVVITVLIIGVVIGGLASWLGRGGWRRTVRRLEREAHELRTKLAAFEGRNEEATIIPAERKPPPRLKLKPPVS